MGNRFLVVEFSGEGVALAEWTRDHPGTTADLISEPVQRKGAENVHASLLLVKGVNRASLVQVMDRMDRVHGPVETLRMEPARGQWMARLTIKESQLHSTAAAALGQFQNRFGSPWSHIADGIIYVRARIPDTEDATRLLRQLRGYFKQHKVDAQCSVEEYSSHDYGVWDDLVQASIGLAP